MPHLGFTSKTKHSSFPRKRESNQLTKSSMRWDNTSSSALSVGGTTGETTSHSAKPLKYRGQAAGYSHSTRLPKDASQVAGYTRRLFDKLDSRFRGNDGLFGVCFRKYLFVLFAALFVLVSTQAHAHSHHSHDSGAIQTIAVAELPSEARDTLRLIKQRGPFPFSRDGVAFGNHEKHLPQQPRGYYHEYTVKTPGAHNRGARRIVCGVVPECYYSGDHYRNFQRIKE